MFHPVTVAAIALLVINDHVLKAQWPGPVTGKLSDVAGVFLLPLLLVTGLQFVRRTRRPDSLLAICILITFVGFTAVKLSPPIATLYGEILGLVRWPVIGRHADVVVLRDPSDLAALPVLFATWHVGQRPARDRPVTSPHPLTSPH